MLIFYRLADYSHDTSRNAVAQYSGQVLDLRLKGQCVQDSPEAMCCVHKQDIILCLVLVEPRNTGNCPEMTEKWLT